MKMYGLVSCLFIIALHASQESKNFTLTKTVDARLNLKLWETCFDYEKLQELLSARTIPQIDTRDYEESTPLIKVASYIYLGCAELLLEHGANINAQNKEGKTPLIVATLASEPAVYGIFWVLFGKTKKFLTAVGSELNDFDKSSWLERMREVFKERRKNLVQLLINNKVDANIQDTRGCTAVHYAAAYSQTEILKLLINYGVDLNVQNKDGYTPLMYAVACQRIDAAVLLIISGASVDIQNTKDGNKTVFNYVISSGDYMKLRNAVDIYKQDIESQLKGSKEEKKQ